MASLPFGTSTSGGVGANSYGIVPSTGQGATWSFGNNTVGGSNPNGATTLTTTPTLFSTHPFQYIQECLDAKSANYRFRYFFYNTVSGGMMTGNAQCRPQLVSERLWTQVIQDNPDPTRMVPVQANGFEDLTMRRAWQNEHQTAQRSKLAELEQRLTALLTRQDLDVTTQLQVIQKQQLKLTLRLLQLMRRVEVLRRAGSRLSTKEQELLGRLQTVTNRIQQSPLYPNSLLQLEGQLQKLNETGRLDPLASARQCVLTDEESISTLFSLLEQQQKGLTALIGTLKKDSRDLEIIRHGLGP